MNPVYQSYHPNNAPYSQHIVNIHTTSITCCICCKCAEVLNSGFFYWDSFCQKIFQLIASVGHTQNQSPSSQSSQLSWNKEISKVPAQDLITLEVIAPLPYCTVKLPNLSKKHSSSQTIHMLYFRKDEGPRKKIAPFTQKEIDKIEANKPPRPIPDPD